MSELDNLDPLKSAPTADSPSATSPEESTGQSDTSPQARLQPTILAAEPAHNWENELRGRLGLLPLGVTLPSRIRRWGWIVTAATTLLAFFTRFWNLNNPRAIIFDETYYVKGAFSLLTQGFEGVWSGDKANDLFLQGDFSSLSTTQADYVVHPPFGKWVMALGQAIFGTDNGVGWRFSTAILGVLSVLVVVRIALRLFRSPVLAGFAGLAMALDGMGIVMSRTGILDNILSFFVLLGFYAILRDRDYHRARLAHRVATGPLLPDGRPAGSWGPRILFRPWLFAAGILLGLSCGVKWSGIYAVAVFGILAFAWNLSARHAVGIRHTIAGATLKDGIPAFLALVPIALATYIGTWISWFLNPNSYDRHWATDTLASGGTLPLSWAPNALNSLWHYHQSMWTFHTGLSTPHDYQSQAWEWLFQIRPVSFYWRGSEDMATQCPHSECVQAITSVGNPFVWWFAVIALIVVIWVAFRDRDWRAWAILAGYAGLWIPWFQYTHRTIFQFYAVAFLPYVILCLTFGIAAVTNTLSKPHAKKRTFESVINGTEPAESGEFPADADAGDVVPPLSDDDVVPTPHVSPAHAVISTHDDVPPLVSPDDTSMAPGNDTDLHISDAGTYDEVSEWATLLAGEIPDSPEWWAAPSLDKSAKITLGVAATVIVAAAAFWMPIWWGNTVSYTFWHLHMWMPSWV